MVDIRSIHAVATQQNELDRLQPDRNSLYAPLDRLHIIGILKRSIRYGRVWWRLYKAQDIDLRAC